MPPNGPVWTLNLRRLGFEPPPVGQLATSQPLRFAIGSRVVATFVTYEAPTALSRRGQVDGAASSHRLHALFIDTKTGRVVATREWPTTSTRSRVIPVTGDKLVALTPERLFLYGSDLTLLNQLDLTLSRDSIKDYWNVSLSPGGKYLLISYEPASDERQLGDLPLSRILSEPVDVRLEWIDLENLQVVARWITRECLGCFSTGAISDDGMVQRWNNVQGGTPFNSKIVEIGKPPDGPWRELCPYYQPYCRPGEFVNNESILAIEQNKGLEAIWLVSTNGEMLFHEDFRENETVAWQGSADGHTLAVAVRKIKGANAFLDIGGHAVLDRILVFDVPSRRWVYTLDAKKQKIKDISGMALSPDGLLLALITQAGILEIYRVP